MSAQKLRANVRADDEISVTPLWLVTYVQSLSGGHEDRKTDDARMPGERMTVAMLAKELRKLSERVESGLAQVNERFDTLGTDLRQFADKITTEFKINLERMESKLDAALDDTREQTRRLDVFERPTPKTIV